MHTHTHTHTLKNETSLCCAPKIPLNSQQLKWQNGTFSPLVSRPAAAAAENCQFMLTLCTYVCVLVMGIICMYVYCVYISFAGAQNFSYNV